MMTFLLGAMVMGQYIVPNTLWTPPTDFNFRVDAADQDPFANGSLVSEFNRMRALDRACVIWGRTGDVTATQCRSSTVVDWNGSQEFFSGDDLSEFQFWNAGGAYAGNTWCDPYTGVPQADECDITFDSSLVFTAHSLCVAGDLCGTTPPCTNGETWDNPGGRLGMQVTNNFQQTALHEVGHALGLDHTRSNSVPWYDCDEDTYDCGVMTPSRNRVSYWPNVDDISGLRGRYNLPARRVQFGYWTVDSAGALSSTLAYTNLPTTVSSALSPRIACKAGTGNTRTCVLATLTIDASGGSALWSSPQFHILTVNATSISVAQTISSGTFSETPADVAFGSGTKFMAVGKRAANASSPAKIVAYFGDANNGTVAARILSAEDCSSAGLAVDADDTSVAMYTHTEPRISYDENSNVFVMAAPTRDGWIRVATFDGLDGSCIDQAFLDTRSVVPAEISCDTHLSTTYPYCLIYVLPHSSWMTDGTAQIFGVHVGSNGDLSDQEAVTTCPGGACLGNGTCSNNTAILCGSQVTAAKAIGLDMITPLFKATSYPVFPLVDDVASYGANRTTGQYAGKGYLISTDRFRDAGSNPGRLLFDVSGQLSINDPPKSDISMSTVDAQTNTSSWDWHEGIARFVSVRMGSQL